MRTNIQMTKQSVMKAVRGGASSLTAVWRACGGTGNIAGSTLAKIRTLVPDIEGRLQKNKAGAAKPSPKKSAKKTTKVKSTKKASPTEYPRHGTNPYRGGSAYGAAYDVLASAGDKGIDRAKMVSEVARLTNKDQKRSYYDVTVVHSPTPAGPANRSATTAAYTYWVQKAAGGRVTLRLRDRRY
jgi:hypothetical protein